MFSLFSKKSNEELALIFDIGSGSIGGAIAVISPEHAPKILYTVRLPIVWKEPPLEGQFLSAITRSIHDICSHIEQVGFKHLHYTNYQTHHLKNIYTIYSSPWYVSQTKVLKIEKQTPVLVTKSLIDGMIAEEEKKYTSSIEEKPHSHVFENAQVIERGIIQTKLNGYDTPNPINKKATHIQTTYFMSFVSKNILDSVQKTIRSHFNYRHIHAYSFPMVAFKAIGAANPGLEDFLLIDLRSEVTDVSLIKDGALLESISYPVGKDTLLRTVSDGMNVSPHIALTYIEMATHNKGTPELAEKLKTTLESFKKQWYEGFKNAIDEITRDVAVPKRVFLVSDSELEILFEKVFSEVTSGYEVHPLKRHELRPLVEMNSKYDDPFLALETVYVNTVTFNSGLPTK